MRPTIPLAVAFISTCADAGSEPGTGADPSGSTPVPHRRGRTAGGLVRHAFMATVGLMLAACGGGEPTATVINGSIRGTVTDNTGATVANAAVALSGNAQPARVSYSGSGGVYTFADVPAGTYTLAVTPPTGYLIGDAGTASVTVAGGAQANASAFVLSRDPKVESCAVARPDFGEATAADRALFAYDASAPLDLTTTVDSTSNGVEFNSISFNSPAGGRATGIMYRPIGRTGLRPGVVVMHASGSPTGPVQGARIAMFAMQELAVRGAVVIGIDAPYARRGGWGPPTVTLQDRLDHIQLMKELQRALDVLLAEENVDSARIGFTGFSYGGMVGVHFAGIEKRLKAAVISAGYGGSVTAATNASPNGLQKLSTVPCAVRNEWLREMTPIEPIRYIPGASPTALLFQIGQHDTAVLPEDAQAAYDAASNPKEVIYYDTGHSLNAQATADRLVWLHKQIGIDP